MTALVPAFLVALFAVWTGTFHGGASWSGALAGDLAALAFALIGAPRLRDPLELGRGGDLLLPALLAAIGASAAVSPVPRAGLEPLALLPAFLLMPAAVERSWRDPVARRRGVRSLAVVGAAVATWGIADAVASGAGRAAAPLGHHVALAVWLLFALPFAALGARERGAFRFVGVLATAACATAILATRSLVGTTLLLVQAVMLVRARRARWWMLGALAAVAIAVTAPRLASIASAADPSVAARRAYLAGGLLGLRARPALGWGPGSVGWTIGEHLPPAPGRNPPGEVVSYLHFLPLDVAYQLGIAGALLAIAVAAAFVTARRRERPVADDPALLDAATASLLPGLVALCFAGFQPLRATLVIAGVAAGAALAATSTRRPALSDRAGGVARIVVLLYTACALGVLLPVRRAERLYDQARTEPQPFARLDRAAGLDASLPLYAARRAWASAAVPPGGAGASAGAAESRIAGEALRAAERAPGVAALWLAAGLLGADAGTPWSASALRRACDLDPLGALAPFRLMTIAPVEPAAATAGARALLAEPRLGAALDWEGREELFERARDQIASWPGVDASWRRQAVAVLGSLPPPSGVRARRFSLELDAEAQTSLSLFVFRRLPWPTELAAIDLDPDRLRAITMGSAALRGDTEPRAFPKNGCGAGEARPTD